MSLNSKSFVFPPLWIGSYCYMVIYFMVGVIHNRWFSSVLMILLEGLASTVHKFLSANVDSLIWNLAHQICIFKYVF